MNCSACGGYSGRPGGPSEFDMNCVKCAGAIRFKPDGTIVPWDPSWTVQLDPPAPAGKTRFDLLDLDFAAAMADTFAEGVKDGRTAGDWKNHPKTAETRDRYRAKILRHLHEFTNGGGRDHLAAIACDACILWNMEGEQ